MYIYIYRGHFLVVHGQNVWHQNLSYLEHMVTWLQTGDTSLQLTLKDSRCIQIAPDAYDSDDSRCIQM